MHSMAAKKSNSRIVSFLRKKAPATLEHLDLTFNAMGLIDMRSLENMQFGKQLKSLTIDTSENHSSIKGARGFIQSCMNLTSLSVRFEQDFDSAAVPLNEADARVIASLQQLRSLKLRTDVVTEQAWTEFFNAKWTSMSHVELIMVRGIYDFGPHDPHFGDLIAKAKWSFQTGATFTLRGFGFTDEGFSKMVQTSWFKNIGSLKLDACFYNDAMVSVLAEVAMPHLTSLSLDGGVLQGSYIVALASASSGNLASIRELRFTNAVATSYDVLAFARGAWKNLRLVQLPRIQRIYGGLPFPQILRGPTVVPFYQDLLRGVNREKWKSWRFHEFGVGYNEDYYHLLQLPPPPLDQGMRW